MASIASDYKVVVLASDSGIGEAKLVGTFVHAGNFSFDAIREEHFRKLVTLQKAQEEVMFDLQVPDFLFTEPETKKQFLETSEGFVACFSVNNKSSFDNLIELVKEIASLKNTAIGDIPMVIVATQCDTEPSARAVSPEEVQKLGQFWGAPTFETSARLGVNITEPFLELGEILFAARKKAQDKEKKMINFSGIRERFSTTKSIDQIAKKEEDKKGKERRSTIKEAPREEYLTEKVRNPNPFTVLKDKFFKKKN